MKMSLTKRIPYKLYDIIQDIRNNGVHQINHDHEQSKSQFIEYDLNKHFNILVVRDILQDVVRVQMRHWLGENIISMVGVGIRFGQNINRP